MTEQKPAKVLVVINTLDVGGAQMQLARVAPLFDRKKFDLHVAYYDDKDIGYPAAAIKAADIKLTFLNRAQWGRLAYFKKTAAFIKSQRFDIVHAWTGTANIYGRLPAILAGVPVILGGARGQTVVRRNIVDRLAYSLTNYHSAGWIVNATTLEKIFRQRMWFIKNKPFFVIPTGLELERTPQSPQDPDDFFNILRQDRPVIGIVGRLHPVKNHLMFIEMANLLTQAKVDADYWIIGDGPAQSQIAQAINHHNLHDRVKMLGYRSDVDAALNAMDILVLTSNTEGCPNALLEAMRASLPVLSTNCTNLEEIIEEGVNGHIVPVNDAPALAQKLKSILADPQLKQQMGLKSRTIFENRFSISLTAKRLQNVYLECLEAAERTN